MATSAGTNENVSTSTNDNEEFIRVEHNLPEEYKSLPLIFSHLRRLLQDNTDYFYNYIKKDVYRRFYDGFNSMLGNIDPVKELAFKIAKKVDKFDYSAEAKGNGYRSLLRLLEHSIRAITELSAYCSTHRDKFYFRSHHYCLEVEAYTSLFQRTRELLQYANILLDGPEDCLISETFDPKIMLEVEEIDRECFYGRTLGFQFSTSLRHFLQIVCIAMASFAEGYHRHGNGTLVSITTSFLNSGKYSVNPELRAKMIVKVTKKTNMEFCKAFWSLTEHYGLQHVPLLVAPAMKVNYLFEIPPNPFELLSTSGEKVSITPPCSWSGLAPVKVRLISAEWREGQNKESMDSPSSSQRQLQPKSNGIILHVHGGGFVAQSSKSHEVYLRVWARELRVPIVSVDYSLAPEAPFPRALEECFFAYAWVLKNAGKLGTTAEFVCLAGDSAGGNICVSLSLRAAEYGIRLPDSLLTAYSPFNVQYVPSPSRLISLMDPLLPTTILAGCLASYAGLDRSPFDECTTKVIKSLSGKSAKPVGMSVQNRKKTSSFLRRFRRNRQSKHNSETGSPSPSSSASSSPVNGSSSQLGNLGSFNKKMTIPIMASQRSSVGSESFHTCQSPSTFSVSFHKHKANDETGCKSDPQNVTITHLCDKENLEMDNVLIHSETVINAPSLSVDSSCQSSKFQPETTVTQHQPDHDQHGSLSENMKLESDANCIESNRIILPPKDLILSNSVTLVSPVDNHLHQSVGKLVSPDCEPAVIPPKPRATSISQIRLPITKNPFMSPLLAPDEMLATLPPIDIVACSLDPILDDSVEFARRLRTLQKDVELYILEDLPHGFLNFNLVSQEAKEGCDLCIACLKRSLTGKYRPDKSAIPPVF